MEAALASFLAPFLGYLLKRGEEVASDAAEQLGAVAWKHAQALWAKLRPRVEERPAAKEAAEDVAAAPDDERARAALELQLAKILAEHEELARELEPMLAEAQRVVQAESGGVAIGGDVRADRGGIAAGRDVNAGDIRTGWSDRRT